MFKKCWLRKVTLLGLCSPWTEEQVAILRQNPWYTATQQSSTPICKIHEYTYNQNNSYKSSYPHSTLDLKAMYSNIKACTVRVSEIKHINANIHQDHLVMCSNISTDNKFVINVKDLHDLLETKVRLFWNPSTEITDFFRRGFQVKVRCTYALIGNIGDGPRNSVPVPHATHPTDMNILAWAWKQLSSWTRYSHLKTLVHFTIFCTAPASRNCKTCTYKSVTEVPPERCRKCVDSWHAQEYKTN